MAQPTTAQNASNWRTFFARLRTRLSSDPDPWCPGTGTPVSVGATVHGIASCPICPERVPTESDPTRRYRIIGEHTA
jgi:hypothetical protein